jgi:hypothetical protein
MDTGEFGLLVTDEPEAHLRLDGVEGDVERLTHLLLRQIRRKIPLTN